MIVDDDLIAKFLSGEASPEEAIALHEWLAVPANKTRFDEMSGTWDQANPSKALKTLNKDAAWRKIRPAKPTKNLVWPIGIAASILMVIAFFWFKGEDKQSPIVVNTIDSTRTVDLSDNSHVTLYHNTSVEFSKDFDRQIKLVSGEAFFKIQKDSAHPFVVHTSSADIRVLGTQFNVIIKDNTVSVGVEEGLVQIITATDSVYVGKGAAAFVRSGEPVRKARMDENTWAYATQKLIFKDTPMAEVIESLEKTYSVNISVSNDDVKKCRFTATFDKDNVEKILLLVSETLNSKLEQNGQDYTLEGGDGCP